MDDVERLRSRARRCRELAEAAGETAHRTLHDIAKELEAQADRMEVQDPNRGPSAIA